MTLAQPRLIIATALALVLVAAVGVVGWTQLRTTARAYESLVENDAGLTRHALRMRAAVSEQGLALRSFLLSAQEGGFLSAYRRQRAIFVRELKGARSKAEDRSELRRVRTIERLHGNLQRAYGEAVRLARDGKRRRAATVVREQATARRTALVAALDSLVSREAADLYRDRARAGKVQQSAEIAILGVLGLALIAGSLAAVLGVRAGRRNAGAHAEAEAARRAAAEEAALARIATAIAHEEEPRAVLSSAAEEAAGLLGAASAAILRFERGGSTAMVVGAAGSAAVEAGRRLRVTGDDLVGGLAKDASLPGSDRVPVPGADRALLRPLDSGTELAVPIWVGANRWGAIWVSWPPQATVPPDAGSRLVRFAELASAAITSADARAHLAQLALEDSLTGLANHRHFHERLNAEVARALRHGRKLSIVLFDIDSFADVNDSHGHHVGDAVLREVADRLSGCARKGELVARVGGEQFGWILPEAGGLDAYQAAERARRAVGGEPLTHDITVTVSAGVCDLEHARSAADLLRFADGALFWAKAHGRDITFRYSPDVVTELSADEQLEHLRRTRTIVGIRALARAVDVKDRSTARHSERVADVAAALARELGWDEHRIALLHEAALVHDVGKIGVPDAVLLKPSQLDPAEYDAIKQHAALGAEIVNDVLSQEQVSWVLAHHERHDGLGYPRGLADGEIPAGARILAVADAWDVMTSDRPYSPARSSDDALREMCRLAGRQFCPEVVRALEAVLARDAAGLAGGSSA